MQQDTIAAEASFEAGHWWFAGRRKLFATEIARLGIAQDACILDLGTSSGTNLRMLRESGFAYVTGLDASDEAIRCCRDKGLGPLVKGDIARLPFDDNTADLVLATDVIEHIDHDDVALHEIARVLKPGGAVLITVPAFPMLWGIQDQVGEHKRRYRRPQLNHLVNRVGLQVFRSYYFNYLLFVPIWLTRRVLRLLKPKLRSEGEINSPVMNRALGAVFAIDIMSAPIIRPPFGVSALVIAIKHQ
jgi:ubiquinone/menaquinone biosynthesis C-methylase UbiE